MSDEELSTDDHHVWTRESSQEFRKWLLGEAYNKLNILDDEEWDRKNRLGILEFNDCKVEHALDVARGRGYEVRNGRPD